jgi:hypothetical protein
LLLTRLYPVSLTLTLTPILRGHLLRSTAGIGVQGRQELFWGVLFLRGSRIVIVGTTITRNGIQVRLTAAQMSCCSIMQMK